MSSTKREVLKAHAVCIPHPALGHIKSMLKFAKLLHFKGFHITFLHTQTSYDRILKSTGPSSLKGLSDFQFKTIPDGLSASESMANAEDMSKVAHINRFRLSDTFREFLIKESTEEPEVTCIVSDTYMSFTLDVSPEFGLPNLSYCSLSACGFMGFFAIKELIDRGIVPLKNEEDLTNGYLNTPVNGVLGLKNMRLRDFTNFVHTTDPNHVAMNFCKDETQDSLKTTAILIHTFDELEGATLDAMSAVFPAVYALGPLDIMCKNISEDSVNSMGSTSSFWANDNSCLDWLDEKAPRSVVYVNFGSLAVVTKDQLIEFAWGLINSNCEFLWVIRPDLMTEDSSGMPEELLVEVKKRGLIISWCAQQQVLRHPSIGVFLTHCGWNSMMESICYGVPLICWPFFGDQQTNCRYACKEWKIGVEISSNVKRDEVEMRIKEVMEGDEGVEIRRNVIKYRESAGKAASVGGTAFVNLNRVVEDVLLSKSCTAV